MLSKPELDNIVAELGEMRSLQLQQEKQVQSLQERLKAQQERLKQLKADSEQTRFAEQKAELEYQQFAERLTDVKQLYQRLQASEGDRKSTRLNSSHVSISYAVFCLKK